MERKSTAGVTVPKAPCVHHVNARGSQCHHNYVDHQRWDYNICEHGKAKYDLAC